jgi:hypothetical protein
LLPGTQVRATSTVWATNSKDRVDLWYAPDATSPAWVLVGTATPSALNASSSVSMTFTLPTGSLQAIRSTLRRGGSASKCPSGSYNDHDDLVFVTQ